MHSTLATPPSVDPGQDVFVLPCSAAQKRFWMLEQISPGDTALVIPIAIKLSGPLRPEIVERALNQIVERHEILRTRIEVVEGEPKQIIAPAAVLKLHHMELDCVPPEMRADQIAQVMAKEAERPVPLGVAPLLRATLVRVAPEEAVLMLTAHHIISDGWSNGLLVREFGAFYHASLRNETAYLPPLNIQYADYVIWQEEWLASLAFDAQMAYWKQELDSEIPALDFPTDFARGGDESHDAILEARLLPKELTDGLRSFCQETGTTLFMIFFSAYLILLQRYTGQSRLLVATTGANRNRPELEHLIGLFSNILLLPSEVSADLSFKDFLLQQRDHLLSSFSHQEAPFEQVAQQWQVGKRRTPKNLIQTHFLFQKAFMQPSTQDGLSIQPLYSVSPGSTFELTFGIVERAEGIRLQMEYWTSLFRPATIQRFLAHFQALLESALAHPEMAIAQLPIFAEGEEEQLDSVLTAPSAERANVSQMVDVEAILRRLDEEIEKHFHKDHAPFAPLPKLSSEVALMVLDHQLQVMPVGVPGDVYLGDSSGGLNDRSETVKRLANDPLLLLKTGFVGRNAEGGGLDLMGRSEDLVRPASFRINRRAVEARRKTNPELAPKKTATNQTPLEAAVQRKVLVIWRDILKTQEISVDDNFFELGGNSFLALRMMVEVGKISAGSLPLSLLLTGATVTNLARAIIGGSVETGPRRLLIPVQTKGDLPPLLFLHGDWLGGGHYCHELARQLGDQQPFYAIAPPRAIDGKIPTVAEMASKHRATIEEKFAHGPYRLGGYCIGALVAMEMARQWIAKGEKVEQVFLVDPPVWADPWLGRIWPWFNRLGAMRKWNLERRIAFFDRYAVAPNRWMKQPSREKWERLRRELGFKRRMNTGHDSPGSPQDEAGNPDVLNSLDYEVYFLAYRMHRLRPLSVPTTILIPEATSATRRAQVVKATRLDPAKVRLEIVPGNHTTCVTQDTSVLAARMRYILEGA